MSLPDGRHFTAAVFACHDGTPYPEDWPDRWADLVALCDTVRDLWGGSVRVVSGYRTLAHNQQLIDADNARGSHQVASGSWHMEGRAADLCPAAGPADLAQFWRVIKQALADGKLPTLGGYAMYPVSGWVHVDCRPKPDDGHVATWPGT